MNLVSNSCIGAYIYQNANMEYTTPFVWNVIKTADMCSLIEHFDTIRFNRFTLEKYIRPDNKLSYLVNIDNLVKVNYIHYLQSNCDSSPRIVGSDRYDPAAYKYTAEKYIERMHKMLKNGEPPTFLILQCCDSQFDYTCSNIIKLCNIQSKYKRIIITECTEALNYANERTRIIIDSHPKNKDGWYAKQYAALYQNDIISFSNV